MKANCELKFSFFPTVLHGDAANTGKAKSLEKGDNPGIACSQEPDLQVNSSIDQNLTVMGEGRSRFSRGAPSVLCCERVLFRLRERCLPNFVIGIDQDCVTRLTAERLLRVTNFFVT